MGNLIKRSPDEEFDTMMMVQSNPTGAWMAIQSQADRIDELEESNKELTLQLLATSGQAADALDKLAKAMEALALYSCEDGCNECPTHERDLVTCGFTAYAALAELEGEK
jgi:hypothetical protein